MRNDLPDGFEVLSDDGDVLSIGFEYSGHGGGDCMILLPRSKLEKFSSDENWAWSTAQKFGIITKLYLRGVSLDAENAGRNGKVPEDWE